MNPFAALVVLIVLVCLASLPHYSALRSKRNFVNTGWPVAGIESPLVQATTLVEQVNCSSVVIPSLLLVRFEGDGLERATEVGATDIRIEVSKLLANSVSTDVSAVPSSMFTVGRLILSDAMHNKFMETYADKDESCVTPDLWFKLPAFSPDQPGTESFIQLVSPRVVNAPKRTEFCFGPSLAAQLPIVEDKHTVTLQGVMFEAKNRRTLPFCPLNF